MEEKDATQRKKTGKRLISFLARFFKLFRVDRPAAIDEKLFEAREYQKEASDTMNRTRATLDGEDEWFRSDLEGDESGDSNNFRRGD